MLPCGLVLVGGDQPLFCSHNYSEWGNIHEFLVHFLGKSGLRARFHLCLGGRSVSWFVQGRMLAADTIETLDRE